MTEPNLSVGDTTTVVVTRQLPYGLLVETEAGFPGLVTGAQRETGARLRVKITDIDRDQRRFAAVGVE